MTRSAPRLAAAAALAILAAFAAEARAACLLANPSFEIAGSSGNLFGGWNQFGTVGSSTAAIHGAKAARVTGPNAGPWTVSGFWQPLDSSPGNTWKVTGFVRVPSAAPLAGQSKAIVNVEWRTSGGALISYESHDVATAATAWDTSVAFAITTAAAPAGTASARLVLGVLQGPGDPARDAIYDRVTFEKQTVPTIDAAQWNDFPSGRTLAFASRTWRVKGTGYYGPGPNSFSSAPSAVWVDANARLHLTIARSGGIWYSSEVALEEALGYGDYVFTTRGRLDTLDPTVVLGLFIWEYGPCYDPALLWWNPFNEVDVEFSRWGNPGAANNAQFVAQPYDWGGNLHGFAMTFTADEVTSHAFRWLPNRVEFRSWRGGPLDESPGTLVRSWTYTGPHIPRPDRPRVHLNLWQFGGPPATTQEVVLEDFRFAPWPLAMVDVPRGPDPDPVAAIALASANPSRGGAVLRCRLDGTAIARLTIHDVAGRVVRTLDPGPLPAGTHDVRWDGRDEAGARVAPGVYLARLVSGGAGGGRAAAARVVVLE